MRITVNRLINDHIMIRRLSGQNEIDGIYDLIQSIRDSITIIEWLNITESTGISPENEKVLFSRILDSYKKLSEGKNRIDSGSLRAMQESLARAEYSLNSNDRKKFYDNMLSYTSNAIEAMEYMVKNI